MKLPLFGDLLEIYKNVPEGFAEIKRKRGMRAPLKLGPVNGMLYSSPEDVHTILLAGPPAVTKSRYTKILSDVFGNCLITAEGDDWRQQHNYLIDHFHPRNADHWTSVILGETENWLENLTNPERKKHTLLASEQSRMLIQNILGQILFGDLLERDTLRLILGDLQSVNDSLFQTFITSTVLFGWLNHVPFSPKKRIDRAQKQFTAVIDTLYDKPIPKDHPSIAAALMNHLPQTPEGRTEVRNQLSILYFAGQDTTSLALAWTLLLLATNPEHIERVRAEANAAITDDGDVDRTALRHTRNVVQEAMRLYPPAHALDRQVNDASLFPGVSARTPHLSPIVVTNLHHDEEIWDTPKEFNPSRFEAENSRGRKQCAFIPFGFGERTCIGKTLAQLELILIVAQFCRKFDFRAVNATDIKPRAAATLRPDPDIKLELQPVPR